MAAGVIPENNVWAKLKPPSFRGIAFPITDRKVNHTYEHVETGQFRMGAYTQLVGDGALRLRYEIPMKQGFQTDWKDVFRTTYPKLWAAYNNREVGELRDPILGVLRVLPGTWEETASVDTLNGVRVSVEFIRTVLPGEDETKFDVQTEQSVAQASGEFFREVKIIPWKQEPSPEATSDPFRQMSGTIEQFRAAKQTLNARLGAVIANVNSVMDSLDAAQADPSVRTLLVANGRKLRATAARALNYSVQVEEGPRIFLVPRTMSWAAVAKMLRVPYDDLLAANTTLSKSPTIESGSKVNVPTNGS